MPLTNVFQPNAAAETQSRDHTSDVIAAAEREPSQEHTAASECNQQVSNNNGHVNENDRASATAEGETAGAVSTTDDAENVSDTRESLTVTDTANKSVSQSSKQAEDQARVRTVVSKVSYANLDCGKPVAG